MSNVLVFMCMCIYLIRPVKTRIDKLLVTKGTYQLFLKYAIRKNAHEYRIKIVQNYYALNTTVFLSSFLMGD